MDNERPIIFPDYELLNASGGKQDSIARERTMYDGTKKTVNFMQGHGGERGAGIWDTNDREDWSGVFNHMCMDLHMGMYIAERLQEALKNPSVRRKLHQKKKSEYIEIIDAPDFLQNVANASWIHDWGKRCDEEDRALEEGERKDKHHIAGFRIAKRIGRTNKRVAKIAKVAITHHFYKGDRAGYKLDLYDKIAILADEMAGQEYVKLKDRFADLRYRWITKRKAEGLPPLINEDQFNAHERTTHEIAKEIFEILDTNEDEFLDSIPPEREEIRFLRGIRERGEEDEGIVVVRRVQQGRSMTREELMEIVSQS